MTKTKHAAMKSSGKRRNVALSSSSAPISEIPNPSKKKALLPERGFSLEDPNPAFLSTVAALGWQKFVAHRKEYIATLVHDFYRGIVERSDGEPSNISKVRGEEVKFSVRVINDYFGLGYYGKSVETKQKTYGVKEMNAIKNRICVEGAVWERSGDHGTEFKILKKHLCDEANSWFHFIRHCLIPTSHTSYVDKERLIAIDAIMSRDKIEVGKLINREINKWKGRKDGYLYFPCLITDLCMEAGVEIEANELREKPQGAFSTKFKTRQKAASAPTVVDAETLQRLVEQQSSLAKFVKEQFEWQKKVNAHATKGKIVIDEPVLPEWMQDEDEDEDNVPLSRQLKAVKKEKVKRARSPAKKAKSPAKKKQKVSSEEEELQSVDLDVISESDEDETRKVSMEISSGEEEEAHTEERGSSSDKTDNEPESPPTQTVKEPVKKKSKAAKPNPPSPKPKHQPSPTEPPTQDQNITTTPQSKPQDQPILQPSPTQPEPEKEPSQQPPIPEVPTADVVTSEATEAGSNPDPQPISPPKKPRIKSVPKKNPFGKKSRRELAAESEETRISEEEEHTVDDDAQEKRQKLQVKKKVEAPKGKPATATCAAFVAASGPENVLPVPVVPEEEEVADVATSAEKEAAAKLAELQAIKEREKAIERAHEQALEEATQRLAEHFLKQAQDKAAAVGDTPKDVTTSQEPEVENAQVNPAETQLVDPAALAMKAWEGAKKRIAATSAKMSQEAEASTATGATSAMVGSDATATTTTTTTEEGGEKDKKEKKKKTAKATIPTRKSGRIRSGALNK